MIYNNRNDVNKGHVRIGELLGLTWDCIDWDNSFIVVNKQLRRSTHGKGGYYLLSQTKTGNIRKIVIAPSAIALLRKEKDKQEHWRRLNGRDWKNDMNLVFTDEFGNHLCHYTVYKHFKDAVKSIDRPELRFHDLRHSFATICIENGDSIKAVQQILGHSTANTTINTYSHVTMEMQMKSANRFEQRFKRIRKDSNSRQESRQEIAKPPETQ